jgi:hypothetical protein
VADVNEESIPGSDLHLARLEPSFGRLCGVIGWRIKTVEQWIPWQRLRDKFGYSMLLRALERCEPGRRWPQDAERVCIQLDREAKEAAREQTRVKTEPVRKRARLVKVGGRWEAVRNSRGEWEAVPQETRENQT